MWPVYIHLIALDAEEFTLEHLAHDVHLRYFCKQQSDTLVVFELLCCHECLEGYITNSVYL